MIVNIICLKLLANRKCHHIKQPQLSKIVANIIDRQLTNINAPNTREHYFQNMRKISVPKLFANMYHWNASNYNVPKC